MSLLAGYARCSDFLNNVIWAVMHSIVKNHGTHKSEGAVHKLYCLKAWQISKVHTLSREITNDSYLQGQTAKKSQPSAPRRVLWCPPGAFMSYSSKMSTTRELPCRRNKNDLHDIYSFWKYRMQYNYLQLHPISNRSVA